MYSAQPITATSAADAFAATVTPTAAPPAYDAADPRAVTPSTGPWSPGTLTRQPAQPRTSPTPEEIAASPFAQFYDDAGNPAQPEQPERRSYLPPAPDGPVTRLFDRPSADDLRAAAKQLLAWADSLDAADN